jgi:membrane fusion protein (multidrug efflux system)
MRHVIAPLLVLVLIGGLAALKFAQFGAMAESGQAAQRMGPPPETVGTERAQHAEWDRTLEAVGTVASSKGVQVTTEVPGSVTRIAFESGQRIEQGETLLELDAASERAALAASTAERDLAKLSAERSRELVERRTVAAAAGDEDAARLATSEANVAGLRAALRKKVVRAPFTGRLGIRDVSLGQYLTPGTVITTLESVDEAFVDFSVPQERLNEIVVGAPVHIRVGAAQKSSEPLMGMIAAIDPAIEERTRSLHVRASVPNADERLRAGMFVDVSVVLPNRERLVIVPMTAIVHASYGDSVFVVENKPKDAPGMRRTPDGKSVRVVRQQFVQTGRRQGDFVAVRKGLRADEEVVTAGAFKLRKGAPVVVTREAVPTAQLQPHPQNR